MPEVGMWPRQASMVSALLALLALAWIAQLAAGDHVHCDEALRQQPDPQGTILLSPFNELGCWTLFSEGLETSVLTGPRNLALVGQTTDPMVEVDLETLYGQVVLDDGVQLTLDSLKLLEVFMSPVAPPELGMSLLVFSLAPTASLTINSSVLYVHCVVLDSYVAAVQANASAFGNSVVATWNSTVPGSLHVISYQRPGLVVDDSWLVCNRTTLFDRPVVAFAGQPKDVERALTAGAAANAARAAMYLVQNVSLEEYAWPAGPQGRGLPPPDWMTIEVLPSLTRDTPPATFDDGSPAPAAWLDLGSQPIFLDLRASPNGTAMELDGLGLMNSCVIMLPLGTGSPAPLSAAVASFMGSFTNDPMRAVGGARLVVRDSVIMVAPDEVLLYQYWATLSTTCSRPFLEPVKALLAPLPLRGLLIGESGSSWVRVRNLTLPGLTLLNVTLRAGSTGSNQVAGVLPLVDPGVQVECGTGDVVERAETGTMAVYWADTSDRLWALIQNLTLAPSGTVQALPVGGILRGFPVALIISASVRFGGDAPAAALTPTNATVPRILASLLITGPTALRAAAQVAALEAALSANGSLPALSAGVPDVDNNTTRWWWGSTTSVVVDLANAAGVVELSSSVQIMLQDLTFTNLVAEDLSRYLVRDPIGTVAVQRHSLPLFAFKAARDGSATQLQLESCTLRLSGPDFAVLYYAAIKGDAWKSGSRANNILIQRTEVFIVAHVSQAQLVLAVYLGWGINATNLLIVPTSPVDLTVDPDGGSGAPTAPPVGAAPAPSVSHTGLIAGVVGGVVGVILLAAVAFAIAWHRQHRRSRDTGPAGAAGAKGEGDSQSQTSGGTAGSTHLRGGPGTGTGPAGEASRATLCGSMAQSGEPGSHDHFHARRNTSLECRMEGGSHHMVHVNGVLAVPAIWRELCEPVLQPSSTPNMRSDGGQSGHGLLGHLPMGLSSNGLIMGSAPGHSGGKPGEAGGHGSGVTRVGLTDGTVTGTGTGTTNTANSNSGLTAALGLSESAVAAAAAGAGVRAGLARAPNPTLLQENNVATDPQGSGTAAVNQGPNACAARGAGAGATGVQGAQGPAEPGTQDAAVGLGPHDRAPPPAGVKWDPGQAIAELQEQLGATANKLVLLDPIGQGGFGVVYRGKWCGLEVAVKTVLFSDRLANTGQQRGHQARLPQQSALLEAAVCTSVLHHNVVATYHYDIIRINTGGDGDTPGGRQVVTGLKGATIDDRHAREDFKLYLVQEYCNASLQDALRNQLLHDAVTKQPDMDLVLTLLQDIARGMVHIHSKNIIHGDLTPGNVLLKQDPESPIGVCGKITDFGLCSALAPGQSHISNITNGTPFYVAPEVVKSGIQTKAADVWGFGVLMWELYRCMPPWVHTKSGGYTTNKYFRRFPATTPRIYIYLCARCLCQRPKERPTFEEILQELACMHAAYLSGFASLQHPQHPSAMVQAMQASMAAQAQIAAAQMAAQQAAQSVALAARGGATPGTGGGASPSAGSFGEGSSVSVPGTLPSPSPMPPMVPTIDPQLLQAQLLFQQQQQYHLAAQQQAAQAGVPLAAGAAGMVGQAGTPLHLPVPLMAHMGAGGVPVPSPPAQPPVYAPAGAVLPPAGQLQVDAAHAQYATVPLPALTAPYAAPVAAPVIQPMGPAPPAALPPLAPVVSPPQLPPPPGSTAWPRSRQLATWCAAAPAQRSRAFGQSSDGGGWGGGTVGGRPPTGDVQGSEMHTPTGGGSPEPGNAPPSNGSAVTARDEVDALVDMGGRASGDEQSEADDQEPPVSGEVGV